MEPFVRNPAAQIDDVARRLEAAFNARDPVALASLYSDSAVLMPPNDPMVSGRAEIQAWFERGLSRLGTVRIVPIESMAERNQAFQFGTFTTSSPTTSSSGDRSAQSGKYVLVLKKDAGHWLIQYDIWSLDQPMR